MASRVILLVGCSGCGKTTYARQQFPKAIVVSADHYFELRAKRARKSYSDVFDTWDLRSAHGECQEQFSEAIAAGKPVVIVDNTNVRRAERQRYIKMASEHGCEIELHVFSPWVHGDSALTTLEVTSYVGLCHERNVHGVPLDIIAGQFEKLDLPSGIYQAGKPPQFIRSLPVV